MDRQANSGSHAAKRYNEEVPIQASPVKQQRLQEDVSDQCALQPLDGNLDQSNIHPDLRRPTSMPNTTPPNHGSTSAMTTMPSTSQNGIQNLIHANHNSVCSPVDKLASSVEAQHQLNFAANAPRLPLPARSPNPYIAELEAKLHSWNQWYVDHSQYCNGKQGEVRTYYRQEDHGSPTMLQLQESLARQGVLAREVESLRDQLGGHGKGSKIVRGGKTVDDLKKELEHWKMKYQESENRGKLMNESISLVLKEYRVDSARGEKKRKS